MEFNNTAFEKAEILIYQNSDGVLILLLGQIIFDIIICLCPQSSSYATATVHLNTGVFLLERAGNQNLWLKVDESKVSGGNMSADVAR